MSSEQGATWKMWWSLGARRRQAAIRAPSTMRQVTGASTTTPNQKATLVYLQSGKERHEEILRCSILGENCFLRGE